MSIYDNMQFSKFEYATMGYTITYKNCEFEFSNEKIILGISMKLDLWDIPKFNDLFINGINFSKSAMICFDTADNSVEFKNCFNEPFKWHYNKITIKRK